VGGSTLGKLTDSGLVDQAEIAMLGTVFGGLDGQELTDKRTVDVDAWAI